jgi:hypothetical protein
MTRKLLILATAAILLAGCSGMPDRDRNIVIGAGAGAGVGALVGSAVGGPPGGWIGAGVGGATGGVIASLIEPDACYYRNRRGELWQVPCEHPAPGAAACYIGNRHGRLDEVTCPRKLRT